MKFICDENYRNGNFAPVYNSFNINEKNCKNSLEIRTEKGII